jgi:zinc D-Ala-D-Ala dipeptidase
MRYPWQVICTYFLFLISFLTCAGLLAVIAPARSWGQTGGDLANREKVGVSKSLQILVVVTRNWDDFHGTAQRYERSTLNSEWRAAGPAFRVVVGKTGLGWGRGVQPDILRPEIGDAARGPRKREGDGKAPAGIFLLPSSFGYSPEPLPGARMPYTALTASVECVDDPQSSHYNQLLDAHGMTKDWNSSEQMRRDDELYRWGVFVAHNTNPTQAGDGSCIFLHIWRGPDQGTVGCTAMEQGNIESLLRWLDPSRHPVLVQLPESEYGRLVSAWSLPRSPVSASSGDAQGKSSGGSGEQ